VRRWVIGLVLAMLAAVACNVLTGVNDLGVVPACDGCDAASPPPDERDASDAAPADATVDASVPSYCIGIVFYARLDGTFATAEGIAADAPPDASFDAGRFGTAPTIAGDASTLYYPTTAGVAYPQAEGSVAMWFRPLWSTGQQAATRSYFKPAGDKAFAVTNNAGPQILDYGSPRGMGATNNNLDASYTEAMLAPSTWKAGWHDRDWNHFVASWRRVPSLIEFTLNGGGAVDGGVMHVETTNAWAPQLPADGGFFRFASAATPIDGAIDDLAVWNRVLLPAEVSAIYSSSQSLGDACKL
jgi:hypothetical protein